VRRDAGDLLRPEPVRDPAAVLLHDGAVLVAYRLHEALALGAHQDLDARLVEVVAAPEAVVDAQDRLDEEQQVGRRHELGHARGDHRRAPHATAHVDREAQRAVVVVHQLEPDVVPAGGRAVLAAAADGDLELARQERELRVQRAPLAQDLAPGARVGDLVGCHARQHVGGDVAHAVAAGLDAVHVDLGQQVHHVGAALEQDPVELKVLPRGEVAEAAALGRAPGVLQVELARDPCQLPQLPRRQHAVRDRHPQHRRVPLHVPAVLQPQRAEVVGAQFAAQVPVELVAVLGRAGVHEPAVEVGVAVHGAGDCRRRPAAGANAVFASAAALCFVGPPRIAA